MKKFASHKSYAQIKRQCQAARVVFDDRLYRSSGDDCIVVRGGGAYAIYNTFNGRFFGTTDKGIEFCSDEDEHDSEPWMQSLLSFFYIEKGAQ